MDLGTEVAVFNSQVVPISQVALKTGFAVYVYSTLASRVLNDYTASITYGLR